MTTNQIIIRGESWVIIRKCKWALRQRVVSAYVESHTWKGFFSMASPFFLSFCCSLPHKDFLAFTQNVCISFYTCISFAAMTSNMNEYFIAQKKIRDKEATTKCYVEAEKKSLTTSSINLPFVFIRQKFRGQSIALGEQIVFTKTKGKAAKRFLSP